MTSVFQNIIVRVDDKPTRGTIARYDGKARPGELVIDPTALPPTVWVGDKNGNLNLISGGGNIASTISNGTSNVNIPYVNGSVNISAGGISNVFVVSPIGSDISGNLQITKNISGNNLTITNDITTSNLVVFNKSNLGFIGNINIDGGSNGQLLQTDGNGNLNWASITANNINGITNGSSNIFVQENSNIIMSVANTSNVFVVTSNSAIVSGTVLSDTVSYGNGFASLKYASITSTSTTIFDLVSLVANINPSTQFLLSIKDTISNTCKSVSFISSCINGNVQYVEFGSVVAGGISDHTAQIIYDSGMISLRCFPSNNNTVVWSVSYTTLTSSPP